MPVQCADLSPTVSNYTNYIFLTELAYRKQRRFHWEYNGVVVLVLLRPPNLHCHRGGWLPLNQHCHCSVLRCAQRSFWTLFPENVPSLKETSDSHLNAASFDPCVNTWKHGESPPALTRTSASPMANIGTVGTVQTLYLVRPSRRPHLVHPPLSRAVSN